jgi:hydrogenase-4 component F
MTRYQISLLLLLTLPMVATGASALVRTLQAALRLSVIVAALETGLAAILLWNVRGGTRIFAADKIIFIDALSAYHLLLVAVTFFLSATYALRYFSGPEERNSHTKRFAVLWNAFFSMLVLALCSNNMGLLWIAIEGSTLFSALLILTKGKPLSVEAMWKYLLLCSVGIAFAFVGTLLLSVAAQKTLLQSHTGGFLWTTLLDNAAGLDRGIMTVSFLFALVGFGTKAGLAPMHTWLPDAHSQAPTPVSVVFSGVMLNVALYCIIRYLPLVEGSMGYSMKAHGLLLLFGLVSIIVAAVFIPAQHDIKRLLAYHSVEHMGIIAVGLGLGGAGTVAALFHTLNHSLSKTLAFFSAGRLAQQYGTHDMRLMHGAIAANPLWGTGFLVSVLALIGMAPFSVFMSEFQIVKTAVDTGRYITLGLFCAGAVIVFISALRHAIDVSMGSAPASLTSASPARWDRPIVVLLIALLLVCGLWLPQEFTALLHQMSAIVNGGVR